MQKLYLPLMNYIVQHLLFEDLTRSDDCVTLSSVGSMTEHPATQGKGGCRSGDESDAQANSVRANCSAVQP